MSIDDIFSTLVTCRKLLEDPSGFEGGDRPVHEIIKDVTDRLDEAISHFHYALNTHTKKED
tara:strand:+ start:343 stop:525 length:183 start_codon:yes stop_codon:yes gene_type:complete